MTRSAASCRLHLTAALMAGVALVSAGCGADFEPALFPVTGEPAAPLGRVFDLDLSLPLLSLPETATRGLDMRLELQLTGIDPGERTARYRVVSALAGAAPMQTPVQVEDLGDGFTDVVITPEQWTSQRIGPLKIGVVTFDLMLQAVPDAFARRLTGQVWESQNARSGPLAGSSRSRFLMTLTEFGISGRLAEASVVREVEVEARDDLGPVSGDPALRRTGSGVFVINRLSFDNLQRLDPDSDFATVWQMGLGVGANPHDVALLPDGRAYVSRYEPPFNDLAVIDAGSGALTGTISLAGLAENPDGTPRADRLVRIGEEIFVGLQDIDRSFTRYSEAKLAVVDTQTDAVVGVIPLAGKNVGRMEVLVEDGVTRLYVALGGIFPGLLPQELSGGVVVVDPVNRALERQALDDDTAGGNIGDLAMVSSALGYAVVSEDGLGNRVVAFDPQAGTVRRTLFESSDFIADIEVDRSGVLAVTDRSFARPGVCFYRVPADPAQAELLLGCRLLEREPFGLEALD